MKKTLKSCAKDAPPDKPPSEYQNYLQSDHWIRTRKSALRRGGFKCALCGREYDEATLEVHHNTYINKGDELPEDLVVLCANHHKIYHFVEYLEKIERL